MTNANKAKGTAAETAVVNYARLNGFPLAERIALGGSHWTYAPDRGDVQLTVGLMAQVKAGKAAKLASLQQIRKWMEATERQRVAGQHSVAVLIVQHQGFGLKRVHEWDCWLRLPDITTSGMPTLICITLDDALTHLRLKGWGTPL